MRSWKTNKITKILDEQNTLSLSVFNFLSHDEEMKATSILRMSQVEDT